MMAWKTICIDGERRDSEVAICGQQVVWYDAFFFTSDFEGRLISGGLFSDLEMDFSLVEGLYSQYEHIMMFNCSV